MKAAHISSSSAKRRQAMALVMVITTVALMSILIVAIFSITRTEFKATQAFVAGKSAKQLSDISTAIVQAQIQNAQNTRRNTARTTHATQPGMVRVYNANGSFNSAYKLYSSAQMKVTGEESSLYSAQHIPPSNWTTLPARFVDLNEPVVRPSLSASAGSGSSGSSGIAVYFPVIDPRAAWNYHGSQNDGEDGKEGTSQVEGFSYSKTADAVGSGSSQDYSSQVVTPTDTSNPDNLRLPMPVEWLYVLEDGTVGYLDSSNKFVSPTGGNPASGTNPIVGRIAFWTDDESCKININTASEPTFMSSPFYFHQRDARWAHFPPVTGEYQRYPGHPATVALSAVLAPNYILDPLLPSVDGFNSYMDIVNLKEQIYALSPKISGGGSEAGTRPFVQDDLSSQNGERNASTLIDLTEASKERLYASVDEMLFKDLDYNSSTGRSQAIVNFPNGSTFFDHTTLERSRFFLTAHSRSPEFSIHGLPRVCMWPVADDTNSGLLPNNGLKWRTSFDNMIALCATIKRQAGSNDTTSRSYYFRRANARSGSVDVGINRNKLLLDYLVDQMSLLTWPATSYASSGSNPNFKSKYGQSNVNQLAVQFFDYIRCTNLYDGILARNNDAWSANGQSTEARYIYRDSNEKECYTFTSQRISEPPRSVNISGDDAQNNRRTSQQGLLPGHGQVSPAIWSKDGRSYKGFGRMFTISEIGFQFICTADGENGPGALSTFGGAEADGKGGGTALRLNAVDTINDPPNAPADQAYSGLNVGNGAAYWWSNFPPLNQLIGESADDYKKVIDRFVTKYGCSLAGGRNPNPLLHPSKHPGFCPEYWNMSLARGVNLTQKQKRVQVMLMLETFCPSLGWTGIYPEFTIVLDGSTIAQMTLNGQKLFNTTGSVPIKSSGNIYSANGVHQVGGHASPTAIAGGRRTRSISGGGGTVLMTKDDGYDDQNTSGHNALRNFTFASDFITVNREEPMSVAFPGEDLKIEIYDTHNWESAKPVQILRVNFKVNGSSVSTVPVPNLAQSKPYTETQDRFGRIRYRRTLDGPHYWCANYEGCIGRMTGKFNPSYGKPNEGPWTTVPQEAPAFLVNADDVNDGRKAHAVRGRLDTSERVFKETRTDITTSNVSIVADETSDVIRTIVPAVGDYRTLAAMYDVPSSWWKPHPFWSHGPADVRQAHSFTGFWATTEPGAKLAQDPNRLGSYENTYNKELQMIGGAGFDLDAKGNTFKNLHSRQADLPPQADYAIAANSFGDFDTGISDSREGPYINKPDEGNFYAGKQTLSNQTKFWRSGYFYETYENAEDWRSGIYMTPNRLVSSPVMFGSLPTGVWGNPGNLPEAMSGTAMGVQDFAPWQTLLFRPHAFVNATNPNSKNSHPGMQDPCDHYLLDLFFMPVVEPYAISEPLSVAGRVNMNYQIMPFTNIRRATGMHAVMKGEYVTAIPNNQITASKEFDPNSTGAWNQRFVDDKKDNRYWHRPIDVRSTLRQFDLKFAHKSGGQENYEGLFRSASQICEMHLIPRTVTGAGISNPTNLKKATSQSAFNNEMNKFWAENRATGDNVRERPYSNLYARLTTRSNTFRVHVRSQVIKKARSTSPETFDPLKDAVVSEYRGSTLLERFIDPNDPNVTIPDYAGAGGISQDPLDKFYRFRALETKRFNP